MTRHVGWWIALFGVCAAAGCEGPRGAPSMGTTTGGTSTTSVTVPRGTMCEILDVLGRECWSCHGTTPLGDAPNSLVTLEQLKAPSAADPAKSYAERAAFRMKSATSPMPPGAGPTSAPAAVALLEAWIAAGYPADECGDAAKDPYAAAAACSGVQLDIHQQEGEDMNPGRACNTCHEQVNNEQGGDAPLFTLAGTVFATAHEPDDCRADAARGAEVVITDAKGKVITLPVNAAGNFTYEEVDWEMPYTAKVRFEGRERAMAAPQSNGACNACHTQAGAEGAPGRILLP